MNIYKSIYGSKESSIPLIIGKDTVYVHSNVVMVSEEDDLYQYDEIQYDKDEYMKLIVEEKDRLKALSSSTQNALIELYSIL